MSSTGIVNPDRGQEMSRFSSQLGLWAGLGVIAVVLGVAAGWWLSRPVSEMDGGLPDASSKSPGPPSATLSSVPTPPKSSAPDERAEEEGVDKKEAYEGTSTALPPQDSSSNLPESGDFSGPAFDLSDGKLVRVWTDKEVYRVGDDLQIHFHSEEDCYLFLFHQSAAGELQLIYPVELPSNNFIEQGKTYTIPNETYGFAFTIQPPLGLERIRALVTRDAERAARWRRMDPQLLAAAAQRVDEHVTFTVVE